MTPHSVRREFAIQGARLRLPSVLLLSLLLGSFVGAQSSFAAAAEPETADAANPFAPRPESYPTADPLLNLVDARSARSLDGDWRLIIDPMGMGNPGSLFGGYARDKQPRTGRELIEYDFRQAQTVRVPGDFNTQDERLFFYRGQVWYFHEFEVEPARLSTPNERTHLWFGGANFDTTVFLNGEGIGRHGVGYVPFSFDVTERLQPGINTLIIRVDNRLTDLTVPTARTDWWPYGGLTRDVLLVSTPKAYIRNARVTLRDLEQRIVEVTIDTVGFDAGTSAGITVPGTGLAGAGQIDEAGRARFSMRMPLALWTPDAPSLHRVSFHAGTDQVSDAVGLRTIATDGARVMLNGEPIRLRGVSTHEEPVGEAGVAHSEAHVLRLLREAKTLGANYVRAAHYPYSRHLARAADRLGMLLWAEIPVYWNIAWSDEATQKSASNLLERLIERDSGRASIAIWSVANETPLSDARMAFLRGLIEQARALDDSRLISAALLGAGSDTLRQVVLHLAAIAQGRSDLPTSDATRLAALLAQAGDSAPASDDLLTLTIDDPLGDYTDVVAYNEYFGWYYSVLLADQTGVSEATLRTLMLELIPNLRITASVDKPVLISEFGAGALWGNRDETAPIWSEDYQALVYEAQLKMLAASPQVQGISPWILKDFRAMLRPLAGVQDYYNRKGLMDEFGRRKAAYAILQEFYRGDWGRAVANPLDAPALPNGNDALNEGADEAPAAGTAEMDE